MAVGLLALIAVLGGCSGDHVPKFANPAPYDAGKADASAAEDDGGTPARDR